MNVHSETGCRHVTSRDVESLRIPVERDFGFRLQQAKFPGFHNALAAYSFLDMELKVEADLPPSLACLKVSCILLNVTWRRETLCLASVSPCS